MSGVAEINLELFSSIPVGCSHSLNGDHNHLKDDETKIRHPSINHMVKSFTRLVGGNRKEVFMGICKCGDLKKCEVELGTV